ncbi:hypothetical protein ZOSMA_82G00510 [Zostera marina]|uniref:Vacuolar ATPase assembly protein VMA22 n=1 Tax=Zostera marina TaxID=29655 RepID=A0A0K9NLW1_ZOSMR|nr:hypothetical protein ZOSMA_82G00510 [Zostera marina]
METMKDEDGTILKFLDTMDNYLILFDSLSSTLRQGWLDLASARHSMGSSRISTALLNLKEHSASTVVRVNDETINETSGMEPHFTLRKWRTCEDKTNPIEEEEDVQGLLKQPSLNLRHRGFSETKEASNEPLVSVDDQVQKERSKALSVFGALVSPKLRSAQISFETVLETLIDIANARSVMLSTFEQLQQMKEQSN